MKVKTSVKALIKKYIPRYFIHKIRWTLDRKYRRSNSFIYIPDWYFRWLAPNLAEYFCWALYPIYKYCKYRNIRFLINNLESSPGQIMLEMDWFLRRSIIENSDGKRIYIAFWRKSSVSMGYKKINKSENLIIVIGNILYILTLPFLIKYSNLTVDCGLSNFKLYVSKNNDFIKKSDDRNFDDVWDRHFSYYQLRKKTVSSHSLILDKHIDWELKNFIGDKKYAVIQIKSEAVNGTAKATDPTSYLEVIRYLQEMGLTVVFAGREQMPIQFKKLNLINYAEWDKNNFYRDILLVAGAECGLTSASGFANVFDVMRVPLVYSNQWSFICPPFGETTITVPTLLGDGKKIWTFKEQVEYFYDRKDSVSAINLPYIRNASSVELYEAMKEVVELAAHPHPKTELQKTFQSQFPETPLSIADSRISNYFINKHICLL